MLLQNKTVAIVGGGPGGLTLAKLLYQAGVDVKVYERDIDKDARVQGSPLDLHYESGLAALQKAGLLDEFKKHYLRGADKQKITNPNADVLYTDHHTKSEENFGNENFRPEIDRNTLKSILLKSIPAETIVWNSHFLSMDKLNNGWLLSFKNGTSAYADLVIGADGANSKIRHYLTDIKPFYTGIIMLEGNVYHAEKTTPTVNNLINGGKLMAFGNNKNLLMGQKANNEIGFYASFKSDEDWAKTSKLDFNDNQQILRWFKKEYPEWSNDWHELFENTTAPFIPRPIYCMPLNQCWQSLPCLTLLGDAAHVMPPFAGEGVNMAMLDALELSENLTSNKFENLQTAISNFEINMRKRASITAKESIDNGELMHSENSLNTMLGFFQNH